MSYKSSQAKAKPRYTPSPRRQARRAIIRPVEPDKGRTRKKRGINIYMSAQYSSTRTHERHTHSSSWPVLFFLRVSSDRGKPIARRRRRRSAPRLVPRGHLPHPTPTSKPTRVIPTCSGGGGGGPVLRSALLDVHGDELEAAGGKGCQKGEQGLLQHLCVWFILFTPPSPHAGSGCEPRSTTTMVAHKHGIQKKKMRSRVV